MQNDNLNKYVITCLVFLILIAAMVVIYFDRKDNRKLARKRLETQGEVMAEWGPANKTPKINGNMFNATPAALTTKISYKNIVNQVAPSVVSVNVENTVPQVSPAKAQVVAGANKNTKTPPLNATPKSKFQNKGKGGSGLIVHRKGYVLTNHHVIDGGIVFTVTLSEGLISKTYKASLVDEAPLLDLAILKIEPRGLEVFTPASIGDSTTLNVGDEVLCMGSPFGLQQTVTFGIVSNTNRSLTVNNTKFTGLIQTDVPINPGSSGGPLININSEVVGINSAIYSTTNAFCGIGFAIPINLAKKAFPEFIDLTKSNVPKANPVALGTNGYFMCPNCGVPHIYGNGPQNSPNIQPNNPNMVGCPRWLCPTPNAHMVANTNPIPNTNGLNKVWLGVKVIDVDKIVKAQYKVPFSWGVLITYIFDRSPAFLGGLQEGDVIFRVNNKLAKNEIMLWDFLKNKKDGDKIKLTIFRNSKKQDVIVTLGNKPDTPLSGMVVALQNNTATKANTQAITPGGGPAGLKGPLAGAEVGAGEIEAMGMGVEELTPDLALAYAIPSNVKGMIIPEVAGASEAAGLLPGDVILEVNKKSVTNMVEFMTVMNKADATQGVLFTIYRQKQRFYVSVKL